MIHDVRVTWAENRGSEGFRVCSVSVRVVSLAAVAIASWIP